jgi:anti-anti-sigma factor
MSYGNQRVTPPGFSIARMPAPEGAALIVLTGEVDLATSGQFREIVDAARAERPRILVADLTEVSFIDSTMLRELLDAHRTLGEGGSRFVVAGAQPTVTRLLDLTGTAKLFELSPTVDAALQPE